MSEINPEKTSFVWKLRDVVAIIFTVATFSLVLYLKANHMSKAESEAVHAALEVRISKMETEITIVREVNNLRLKQLDESVNKIEFKVDKLSEEIRAFQKSVLEVQKSKNAMH